MRKPQGVASLALGWVLHWAFSPRLLNPKLEYVIYCFYITKFKYHLCYYLNLFAILAKGTVRQNVNMLSDASSKLKQQTLPLMGATRPASGIKAKTHTLIIKTHRQH